MTPGDDGRTVRPRFQLAVAVLMILLGAIGLLGSYWIGSLLAILAGALLGVASWRQVKVVRNGTSREDRRGG